MLKSHISCGYPESPAEKLQSHIYNSNVAKDVTNCHQLKYPSIMYSHFLDRINDQSESREIAPSPGHRLQRPLWRPARGRGALRHVWALHAAFAAGSAELGPRSQRGGGAAADAAANGADAAGRIWGRKCGEPGDPGKLGTQTMGSPRQKDGDHEDGIGCVDFNR